MRLKDSTLSFGRGVVRTGACALVPLAGVHAASGAPPSFRGLGELPGGKETIGVAVGTGGVALPSGPVAIGTSDDNDGGCWPVRWDDQRGLRAALGTTGFAAAASADGSVIAGRVHTDSGEEAFVWSPIAGEQRLGFLLGGANSSVRALSPDACTAVGLSDSSRGPQAFRYQCAGEMEPLGDLPGGLVRSTADGVSADGQVVVGMSGSEFGPEAFRWTPSSGMVGLGVIGGLISSPGYASGANAVSADGQVVVGWSSAPTGTEAFRWTPWDGMVSLGDLPGGATQAVAHGVSADGEVVVGVGHTDQGSEAFVWTSANGMLRVQEFLGLQGVDVQGWVLTSATAISPDGQVIAGTGVNPGGKREAWMATLDVCPGCSRSVPQDPPPSPEGGAPIAGAGAPVMAHAPAARPSTTVMTKASVPTNAPAPSVQAEPRLIVRCRADYDRSGSVDVHDLFVFVDAYLAGGADFNASGRTDLGDFIEFLNMFFGGC